MADSRDLVVSVPESSLQPLFARTIANVRDDMLDSPYIVEAMRVLPVGGFRSAIGSVWNAVVDDLRNKIIHRSLSLFNKAVNVGREVKTYEDFQNLVNDDNLIEGAYKIGVIGWEASKVLKHAKETRHIFDGHPKSSDPSIIKVLAMFEDCANYVLKEPFPSQIVDIDEYIETMGSADYDRNAVGVVNALGELPEVYKNELINRLFTSYVHPNATTTLRSNIEFASPILWKVLPKPIKIQVGRRLDVLINEGNATKTALGYDFIRAVGGNNFLTPHARLCKIQPLVAELKENLDTWAVENRCVRELSQYAAQVPPEILKDYVWAITHTYVGHMGNSGQFSRQDFYANGAATVIPTMFEKFDDSAAQAFVETIRESEILRRRLRTPAKLSRLRSLGNIVSSRMSESFAESAYVHLLVDETNEDAFLKAVGRAE